MNLFKIKYIVLLIGIFIIIQQKLLSYSQVTLDVKLFDIPASNDKALEKSACQYTLPDLHGNTLKLLNALLNLGVIKMNRENYIKFYDYYYKKITTINKNDLIEIKNLISSITITKIGKKALIRFIGDEFCDRGSNDFYTILLISKIMDIGLKCEFIISNHGFEFIHGYENEDFISVGLEGKFAHSLIALKYLITKELISKNEVMYFIEKYYKPNLKIISYSDIKDSKSFILYSHAPVGLKEIWELTNEFGIAYKDIHIEDLKNTINQINNFFQEKFVKQNIVHTIFYQLEKFLWNRDYSSLIRPSVYNDYKINFVHGHDSGEETNKNIFNLDYDNYLGKTSRDTIGQLQIFICNN